MKTSISTTIGVRFSQVFLLRASFRHRSDVLNLPPSTPLSEQKINVTIDLLTAGDSDAAGITVTVKTEEEDSEALYQFEVAMTALVASDLASVERVPPVEYLARSGVHALFPFVREAVANITMRGRFGPVWLKPFSAQLAVKAGEAGLQPHPSGPTVKAERAKIASTKPSKRL
jgi:preprotein translocase subunit SecB